MEIVEKSEKLLKYLDINTQNILFLELKTCQKTSKNIKFTDTDHCAENNKVALVTGSGSGIGAATAILLAQKGINVNFL